MQTWKLKKKLAVKPPKLWRSRVLAILLLLSTFGFFLFDFPFLWNRGAAIVEANTGWKSPRVSEQSFRLGLDLQGGAHLVYEADMNQIPEADREEALEGVRDVIERRVNAFGVSEPIVQTTTTGGTYRIVIELAGVSNISQAIAEIGETPVLEFKEPSNETDREPTEEEKAQLDESQTTERAAAHGVLNQALAGANFDELVKTHSVEEGADESLGIIKNIVPESRFGDYAILIEQKNIQPKQIYTNLFETDEGISIVKVLEKGEVKEMQLSHLLICFEGKTGCANPIPEIEAGIKIQQLKDQATPENFTDLVRQNSADPSAAQNSGDLGWATADRYVDAFALAAAQTPVRGISNAVETEFGYHLIFKRDERPIAAYTVQRVLLPLTDISDIVPPVSPWKNTELSGKHLERAQVQFDQNSGSPFVALTFNEEGGQFFGDLTAAHVNEPIAIFLDGTPISIPVVQQAIYGGQAVISGDFTLEEAKLLAQRLNAGALPVPIELVSQQSVGPTLGAVSLQKSIRAARVGFVLVALYMIAFYRLPGLLSVIALVLFAVLNLAAYRAFNVTITLSGIAGFIFSIGIAVDANVLIFERMREEFAAGRDFASSLEHGFKRAWSAIRDGHLTTLIAAAVLYWFSSSFIQGFALTLGIGVLLSLFTAISVTRVYLKIVLNWKWARNVSFYRFKKVL